MEKLVYLAIIVVILPIVFISLYELLNIKVMVHEIGHVITCQMFGHLEDIEISLGTGKVVCELPVNLPYSNYLLYSLGGIIAEFLFGLLFLIIPYTSAFGGYIIFRCSISHLISAYSLDLKGTGFEIFSALPLRILIVIAGFLIFVLSSYSYSHSWTKLIKEDYRKRSERRLK